jgi:hypothetical protein
MQMISEHAYHLPDNLFALAGGLAVADALIGVATSRVHVAYAIAAFLAPLYQQ